MREDGLASVISQCGHCTILELFNTNPVVHQESGHTGRLKTLADGLKWRGGGEMLPPSVFVPIFHTKDDGTLSERKRLAGSDVHY